jgi:hypothetical protein
MEPTSPAPADRRRSRSRQIAVGALLAAALAVPCAVLVAAVRDDDPADHRTTYATPSDGPAGSTVGLTELNGAMWAACLPDAGSTLGVTEMNGAFWAAWYEPAPAPVDG